MDEDKLEEAVHAAIHICGTADDRIIRFLEYMDHLKAYEHWCDAELTILHDRMKEFLAEPDRLA